MNISMLYDVFSSGKVGKGMCWKCALEWNYRSWIYSADLDTILRRYCI